MASELIRRNPGLGVIETHPGGGQYDCLSVIKWAHAPQDVVHLNREGSIHVCEGDLPAITWAEDRQARNRHHCIKLIEDRARLQESGTHARTSPAVLVARIAHQIVLLAINDKSTWDVRNVRVDTSGYGNGDGDVNGFPSAESAVNHRRADDPFGDSRYRFWHVLKDGERVAVFDNDGLIHLRDREPLDMMTRYQASERSVSAVGAWVRGVLDGP